MAKGTTTIFASRGGKRLVGGVVTETTGQDIHADTIVVALGPQTVPPNKADAQAPTVDNPGDTTASRLILLLVDGSTTLADNQWLWAWVSDDPEVEPIRLDGPYNIR